MYECYSSERMKPDQIMQWTCSDFIHENRTSTASISALDINSLAKSLYTESIEKYSDVKNDPATLFVQFAQVWLEKINK